MCMCAYSRAKTHIRKRARTQANVHSQTHVHAHPTVGQERSQKYMSCALLPCRRMLTRAHILWCADTLSHICHNNHACLVKGKHTPLVGAFLLMYCSMVVCVIHISLMQRLVQTRRHAELARRPHGGKGVLRHIARLWPCLGLTRNTHCSFCFVFTAMMWL